jgi:hypothetical protein
MDLNKAFDELQQAADANPEQVKEARRRRDLFTTAFEPLSDVAEVVPSGSLARSTQREPINDVDVIIVFEQADHEDWGAEGDSAGDALNYAQSQIKALLGTADGTVAKEIRLAKPRNHSVKCWFDGPEDPHAFTADAMPALRQPGGELLVPEKANRTWVKTHPEDLIRRVADRQQAWDWFRPLVRALKLWNDDKGGPMKSLVVEVLALSHLPVETSRPRALQRFFQAAYSAIDQPIEDPAGFCGEIQPDLDRLAVKDLLDDAASYAWRAVSAQDSGETDRAACLWRCVFGDAFPEPDGGCSQDGEGDAETGQGAGFNIGTGLGVGGAAGGTIGVDKKRPVTDAPQG